MSHQPSTGKKKYRNKLYNKSYKHPFKKISSVFLLFDPGYVKDEMTLWQQLALVNDNSAYEEGSARERLINFCSAFNHLSDALFIIYTCRNRKCLSDQNEQHLSGELDKKLSAQSNPSVIHNEDAFRNAMKIVRGFCNIYSIAYAQKELWDLLDAVITYIGKQKISKHNLVLFYQCLLCLVSAAYFLHKKRRRDE